VHTLKVKVKRVPRDLPESLEEWLKCAEEAFEEDSQGLPGAFEVRLRPVGSGVRDRGDGLGLGGAAATNRRRHQSSQELVSGFAVVRLPFPFCNSYVRSLSLSEL